MNGTVFTFSFLTIILVANNMVYDVCMSERERLRFMACE